MSAEDRFKIISNGRCYRIKVLRKFFWISWWGYVRDARIDSMGPWETYSKNKAEEFVRALIAQDAADKRGWSEL